jgi:hypothetical protein
VWLGPNVVQHIGSCLFNTEQAKESFNTGRGDYVVALPCHTSDFSL